MSQLTTKTLRVDGMTCTGCEGRIERKLRSAGVANVVARYSDGSVQVTCDTDVIDFRTVGRLIEELDYRVVEDNVVEDNVVQDNVKKEGAQRRPRVDALTAIWVAVALYELYALLDRFGLLDVFYAFPEARTGMGWGMLFVIGALTSVHCIAMCGGINLSQSLIQTQGGRARSAPGFAAPPETPGALIQTQGGRARSAPPSMPRAMVEHLGGRWAVLRSGLLYNLGRLASYTLVGGIVGALGSVVSLSGSARGWVQLIAGAFMVVMGLNMLNVFPWLRRLNPRMPKVFADKIHSGGANRTPLYVGLLNGLMPCGPLQAMQIYALSTGSFVRGAAAMFFFGAGTLPLMFGLS
ncbi:MAG: sulfite exporter TauE/SafE family protein, partial [Synergistaceae bacterium]|nr:sulfite exporter TauE/SafE family protein [Synergistaceae bacterium]